jgi:hypothetical protein
VVELPTAQAIRQVRQRSTSCSCSRWRTPSRLGSFCPSTAAGGSSSWRKSEGPTNPLYRAHGAFDLFFALGNDSQAVQRNKDAGARNSEVQRVVPWLARGC